MTKRTRLQPEDRAEMILAAATTLARKHGYDRISKTQISKACGTSPNLVNHHFGTMDTLRKQLMRRAIKSEDLEILRQGLVARDRIARRAPLQLREAAFKSLL